MGLVKNLFDQFTMAIGSDRDPLPTFPTPALQIDKLFGDRIDI
jgi:hypothetical protein